jgi:anti-sigma-K factor RskA
MSSPIERRFGGLTCSEVSELAGLYVLGSLSAAERQQVIAHLAECPQAHAEIEELGGAVPALATSSEPLDAPAALRSRVMAAYRADVSAPATLRAPVRVPVAPLPAAVVSPREFRRPWLAWAGALAAVLVIAVLGGYSLTVAQRADREAQRAEQIADAIDALAQPDATVAFLSGTGTAAGARGFAAFRANGEGYLVMVGLPDAPAGHTYQAWYILAGQATSAGLLTVDPDGYAVLDDLSNIAGADLVALTIERASGVAQPTSDPVAEGELHAPVVTTPAVTTAS